MDVSEKYAARVLFTELGGFTSSDFTAFCREYNVLQHEETKCWPVFHVMSILNGMRKKGRFGTEDDLDRGIKAEKLQDLRLKNRKNSAQLIDRDSVIQRVRTTNQAISGKVRYGIKMAAARVTGLQNTLDIENIMIECYESALDHLLEEAKNIESWATHGYKEPELDVEQGGERLAEDSEESISTSDSEEDTTRI